MNRSAAASIAWATILALLLSSSLGRAVHVLHTASTFCCHAAAADWAAPELAVSWRATAGRAACCGGHGTPAARADGTNHAGHGHGSAPVAAGPPQDAAPECVLCQLLAAPQFPPVAAKCPCAGRMSEFLSAGRGPCAALWPHSRLAHPRAPPAVLS